MARALVHIDAGVLIGFLDKGDAHHDAARIALEGVLRAGDRGADQLITTDRRWPSARALKLGADIVEL